MTLTRYVSPRAVLKAALFLGVLLAVGALNASKQARAEGAWCADQGGRSGYTSEDPGCRRNSPTHESGR
jgi:hypothetical protein